MYKKILAATDGSEAGLRAVELAGDLAKLHDAELVLLHVVNPADEVPDWLHYSDAHSLGFIGPPGGFAVATRSDTAAGAVAEEVERQREQAQQAANHLLDNAGRRAAQSGARIIKSRIEEGPPADRILEVAKNEGVDAIAMGSRGFGNLKGLLAGSVSSEVAKKAECSCIAVT